MIDLIDYACLTVIGMLFGSLKDGNFDKFCKAVGREPSPRTQAIYNLAKGRFVNVEPVLDRSEGTANNRRLFFKILLDGITKDTRIVVDLLNNQGLWYVSGVLWIPSQSHPMVLLGEYQAGELNSIARTVKGINLFRLIQVSELISAISRARLMRSIAFVLIGICTIVTYVYVVYNFGADKSKRQTHDAKAKVIISNKNNFASNGAIDNSTSRLKETNQQEKVQAQQSHSGQTNRNTKNGRSKPTAFHKSIYTTLPITTNSINDNAKSLDSKLSDSNQNQHQDLQKTDSKTQPINETESNQTSVKVIQAQTQITIQTPSIEAKANQTPSAQTSQKIEQPAAPQLINPPEAPQMPGNTSISSVNH